MTTPLDGYADIPKPRKPTSVGRAGIGFSGTGRLDKQANYLMEMLKFFPDYERKMYAGQDYTDDLAQYGPPELDPQGNFIAPSFGDVVRSYQNNQIRGAGQGKGISGLQFDDEAVGDFEHVDGYGDDDPVTSLIDSDLWADIKASFKTEKRSYYEMMMGSIDTMDDQDAYHLMVSMLESRNRINTTMNSIFGAPGQADSSREAVFNEWFSQNAAANAGQKGFFLFFLGIQQSYSSRIAPLSGGTNQFYVSDLDKEKAAEFFSTLSEKVANYIGVPDLENVTDEELMSLPQSKQKALLLWDAWLNPTQSEPTGEDPFSSSWVKDMEKKLQQDIDKVINMSIGGHSVTRSRNEKYKEDMAEYELKIEDAQKVELDQKKAEIKRQNERKTDSFRDLQRSNNVSREAKGLNKTRRAAVQPKQVKANVANLASRIKKLNPELAKPVSKPKTITTAQPVKTPKVTALPVNVPVPNRPVARVAKPNREVEAIARSTFRVRKSSGGGSTKKAFRSTKKKT